jgi:glycosyltransferase involved in cell wall biosynthesis
MHPLVAVVTPVRNGSPYLERTIACVQAQTYPNVVHVLLDNASTDDTPAVIAKAQGGRVPVLARRNPELLPLVENWNAAIAMTPREATYVKFLCADDLIRADAIEQMATIAEAHPNVQLVTAVDVFDDWIKSSELDRTNSVCNGRDIVRRLLGGALSWFPFPHLFFRVTPGRLNNPFDPDTMPAPDADLVMRLLLDGDMGFVNAPLFYTRKHAASATDHMGGDRLFIITGLNRLKRYGHQVLTPPELERHCRGALRALLRHVLAWQAMGQSHLAAQTLRAVADLGFRPRPMDYFAAVATWPEHKLRKEIGGVMQRMSAPPMRLTEADFLSGAAAGRGPAA